MDNKQLYAVLTELNMRMIRSEELLQYLCQVVIAWAPSDIQRELSDHYLDYLHKWRNSPSAQALKNYLEKENNAASH